MSEKSLMEKPAQPSMSPMHHQEELIFSRKSACQRLAHVAMARFAWRSNSQVPFSTAEPA